MSIVEHYFTHKTIRLYYLESGKGSPLMFLPGGLRVATYLKNIEYLSQFYRVISLDLPGFGKSTTPHEVWGLEEYADFISYFIEHMHLTTIPIVGHSYGGGVGLYLAMQNKHITKLMSFSPMGVKSKYTRLGFYYRVLVTKSINDYRAMQSERLKSIVFNNAISTVTENLSGVPKMLQITNKVLDNHTNPEELAKISIPVNLVWGKYDELFPVQNGKYLQKHIPKSKLEVLDGNHDWLTLNPQASAEKIREFIK
jgi:pimeloyl-ACP methyl ester carboxylesterase